MMHSAWISSRLSVLFLRLAVLEVLATQSCPERRGVETASRRWGLRFAMLEPMRRTIRTAARCTWTRPARAALFALLITLGSSWSWSSRADPIRPVVYVVPITGIVDLGLALFVERVLQEATDAGAAAVILEIDTFGGRVDGAVLIRDDLLLAQVPTVAFVNKRAISAGALITLVAEKIAMVTREGFGGRARRVRLRAERARRLRRGADRVARCVGLGDGSGSDCPPTGSTARGQERRVDVSEDTLDQHCRTGGAQRTGTARAAGPESPQRGVRPPGGHTTLA
jgi:hypothetical protein